MHSNPALKLLFGGKRKMDEDSFLAVSHIALKFWEKFCDEPRNNTPWIQSILFYEERARMCYYSE